METRVLDAHGRPIVRAELRREAARPGLASIRQPWQASIASGLTPARLAGILRQADEGEGRDYLALAEEMEERDPHYASVLGIRKRAVSGLTPAVEAASDDPRDEALAEEVRDAIAEHDGFADLVENMMDAVGKGWSAVEIIWDTAGGRWSPGRFAHRDPRFFRWDRDTGSELRLLTDAAPVEGEPLPPGKFIGLVAANKSGLPLRGGLARLVAFSWICKAYGVKDWVAFAELYGLPLRLGRYGPEATPADVDKLFQAVSAIGTDAAAVLPRSMQIDFQELNAGAAGAEVFENLARWTDEQISKAVLGQTMTSDSGSSRAQAEVHNEVRHDILESDARRVSGALNRDLIRVYVDLNWGPQARYPRLTLPVAQPEDTASLVKSVVDLAPLGMRFSASELHARVGLRPPADDEEAVGAPAPAPAPAAPAASALNRAGDAPAGADPYEGLDEIEREALADWRVQMAPIVDPVERLVASAASYDEVLAGLPGLLAEMSPAELIDRLVRASFKARAMGDADG